MMRASIGTALAFVLLAAAASDPPRAQGRSTVPDAVAVRKRAAALVAHWTAATKDWVVEVSTFDVWVGGDSTAKLSATFEVVSK